MPFNLLRPLLVIWRGQAIEGHVILRSIHDDSDNDSVFLSSTKFCVILSHYQPNLQ